MNRSATLFAIACCVAPLAASTRAQPAAAASQPAIGQPAPALSLDSLLQAPRRTKPAKEVAWADFKGGVVVLEFWATWCGPCVGAIPHLNELADAFRDEPVRFLSVTDEDAGKVSAFLGKREMKSWIGLDTDKSMLKAYDIRAIPRTFLVDRQGRIAAVTHPDLLKEEHIRAVLRDEAPDLAVADAPAFVAGGAVAEPIFQIVIRETGATCGTTRAGRGPGYIQCDVTTLPDLIAFAFEWDSLPRTSLPESLDRTTRYSLHARAPSDQDGTMLECLRAALRGTFGVTARVETREMDVVVCRAPSGPGKGLTAAATKGSSSRAGPDHFEGVGVHFGTFPGQIEFILGKPVIDETGIEGQFDFKMTWKAGDQQDRLRVLLETTGIVLREERRSVEVLVVEQVPRDDTEVERK